ncbi:hypothetical protein KKD37_02795 [Patescibacteria group bacterium]|nr:hypothetical protein [Patescibacteria group bacterium]
MSEERLKPGLIIISGPSGGGKDSVMREVIEATGAKQIITYCVGREPREGEVEGIEN